MSVKDEIYYSDLYDRFTVEEGRRLENGVWKDPPKTDPQHKLLKGVHEMCFYFWKGERYQNKSKVIQAWLSEDRRKKELIEKAEPIDNIHCLACNTIMDCTDKEIWDRSNKEYILFTYRCPNCKKMRAFYNDGTEFRTESKKCGKCQSLNIKEIDKKTKAKIISQYICIDCGHKKEYVFDFTKRKEKPDNEFIKDRERFCLTEEEGKKFLIDMSNLNQAHEAIKEIKKSKT